MLDIKQLNVEMMSWLGTPWKHGIARKGFGVDCIQFAVHVYINLGILPSNFKTIKYKKDWSLHNSKSILENELGKYATKICIDNINFKNPNEILHEGDILTFVFGKCASHAGLYFSDGRIIHSYIQDKVRIDWLSRYRHRLSSAWRVK